MSEDKLASVSRGARTNRVSRKEVTPSRVGPKQKSKSKVSAPVRRIDLYRQQVVDINHLKRLVKQAIVNKLDLQQLYELVCRTAVDTCGFSRAWIGTVDAASQRVAVAVDAGNSPGIGSTLVQVRGTDVISVESIGGSYVATFLISVGDRVCATLNLSAPSRGFLGKEQQKVLAELADVIALAVHILEREAEQQAKFAADHLRMQRLERAIDRVKLGIWELDIASQAAWWSPQMYALLGLENTGLIPGIDLYLDCIHPEERQHIAAFVEQIYHGQLPDVREFRSNPERGPIRILAPTIEVDFDEHRRPVRVAGTLSDVSEYRQIEAEVRENETRFRILAESMAVAVLIYDAEGVVYANPAAERLTGYSSAELMGKSVLELAHPESRAAVQDRVAKRLRGEPVKDEIEIRMITKDDSDLWISLQGTDSTYRGRQVGMVTAFDITERKRTSEALNRRYRELAAIYAASQRLQKLLSPEQLAREAIEVLESTVKYQYGAVLLVDEATNTLYPFALSDQARGAEFLEADMAFVRSQSISRGSGVTGWVAQHNMSVRIDDVREDPRYLSLRNDVRSELCVPLRIQDKLIGVVNVESPEVGAYSEDDQRVLETIAAQIAVSIQNTRLVEDLGRHRDRLTDVSRSLAEAREKESRAIGRELHDQIGQILTALKLTLNLIPRLPPVESAKKLAGAEELVTDLLERVSRLSLELRPPMLDDLGLTPALLWHVNRFQELSGIVIDFKHSGIEGKRFAAEVETSAYRIVQESLTNVVRHANARRVDIQVRVVESRLVIKISDNGTGFDTESALKLNRGLSGIRERAELLGGEFFIESREGSGTSTTIHLPLKVPSS